MLEHRLAECRRHEGEVVSVLSVDVDNFRAVNEQFGHGVGDCLLASVAAVVKSQLRQMDMLSRFEGGEFVAVMPGASARVAAAVAERVGLAVESHDFNVKTGRSIRVTVSTGAGCYPEDGETADDLLAAATRDMRRNRLSRAHAHAPAATVVVSAQNGVANETAILRRFAGTYAVTVMLPATHLEPGTVVQRVHPVPGILDIGRFPGGTDATAAAVAEDLRAAGFESVPRADIMAWKYRKLLMNIGNGIDAACRPGPAAEELARRATAEGEAVLAAAGIAVVGADEDRARRADILRIRTDDRQPPMGGSTWQSIARGTGNVEIDYLSGEIVLLGRLHGHPAPINELVGRVTADLSRSGGEPRSLDAADLLSSL